MRVWVAACSRGQEVYSLAMFLDYHLRRLDPTLRFEILGTDIDEESVSMASNGVYLREELKAAPVNLVADHWARGTGDIEAYVKAKKSLRERCRFQSLNLLSLRKGGAPLEKFDLIFCRNVFIYFKPEQIREVSEQLLSRLQPHGFFVVGLSESLLNLKLEISSVGPSIYRPQALQAQKPVPAATSTVPAKIARVLCVDDSPVILKLLKQVLVPEHGFEVVGTASNGIEASAQLQTLKPDLMTLDIHMPEQTGIEYLQKNFGSHHPPVVMITSVSRENAELSGRALDLGAADYVEKPSLNELQERADEIRIKLRCALLEAGTRARGSIPSLDRTFQRRPLPVDPEQTLQVAVMALSARKKFAGFLRELLGMSQPPVVVLVEGAGSALDSFAQQLSRETGRPVRASEDVPEKLNPSEIVLVDLRKQMQSLWSRHAVSRKVSVLVYGELSAPASRALLSVLRSSAGARSQLLLEDIGGGRGAKELMSSASDVVPATSFAYLSSDYLAGSSDGTRKAA